MEPTFDQRPTGEHEECGFLHCSLRSRVSAGHGVAEANSQPGNVACCGVSADSRGRIASLGVGRLTSVNPFAGKLAAHGDRPNVGAISLSGPRCRSTSSGLAALPHAFDPLVALGVHESSQRMVTAAANPTVSDCAVCRSFCQGPIRCQGRDAGKEERGSPAVVRVRFAA